MAVMQILSAMQFESPLVLSAVAAACVAGVMLGLSTWRRPRPTCQYHVLRLCPGEDVKACLLRYIKAHNLNAVAVVTCVGSLQRATLRLANADRDNPNQIKTWDQRFEICSLVGTLGRGSCHLHMTIADADGQCFGGHVVDGNLVFTTAEIVLVQLHDWVFERQYDSATGFPELHPVTV